VTVQIVVLCGGLATRLGPRAAHTPKLLVEVSGRPFAALVLPRFAAMGFTDAVLCVGHLGEAIRGFVGDGSSFGLRARYADDGHAPLGTWGALRSASSLLADRFVVTYGDSLLSADLGASLRTLAAAPWASGAMLVWRNRDAVEPSNVRFEGGRVVSYGRDGAEPAPDAIDYGATALRREAVLAGDDRDEAPSGLGDLFADLARRRLLAAHEVGARFHEIGSPAGLAEAEAAVRAGDFGPTSPA
jgi:MurNAc alpha-1-phosphate uridylyltransferase